jgi:hypothetical protein
MYCTSSGMWLGHFETPSTVRQRIKRPLQQLMQWHIVHKNIWIMLQSLANTLLKLSVYVKSTCCALDINHV